MNTTVTLDATVQNDPKYKKYTQQVEKCLSSFDNVHEWADFISFLKQLLKVRFGYRAATQILRIARPSKRTCNSKRSLERLS